MPPTILDTDILSALMRQNPRVVTKARQYLEEHGRFTLSAITMYEIQRGLKARNAIKQQKAFKTLCRSSTVLPVDDAVVDRASSSIYADLASRDELIGDADILITATALVSEMRLATNNLRHFRRISGLRVENWME
jgi:tRNA(fMet)-specific endonuclease VapC